ncbi:hypothetical protein WICMUC_003850 [Wickerhamomyces mucosus]|uniref:Maltose/galactoside acetyltransferase domain-containing protein n=1 Tax=Wickerhamomyces mucosus TaxID=1378264 RepID=A0A9P8PJH3_9ASCO|nr:hypothetical protein WICMUC_003850 [Wickerhamomyces mucosus]
MTQRFEKDQELIKYAYENLKLNVPKGHEEYEKMISGIAYDTLNRELQAGREEAHQSAREYSTLSFRGKSIEEFNQIRLDKLKTLFGEVKGEAVIEAPLSVDYGYNTSIGKNFYANFNLTILDSSIVKIGDFVEFGPNVVICCATHPLEPEERLSKDGEWSRSITVGNKAWIGANVTVLPGVTIGDGAVIGANAVVTRDVPSFSVSIGAPAKILQQVSLIKTDLLTFWLERGTSRHGFFSKKPDGFNSNDNISTGMTGKSSGLGIWVNENVCHKTGSSFSTFSSLLDQIPKPVST